jgi:hypothetical protein
MATDNFAYGFTSFPDMPRVNLGAGVKTDFALMLPPQARVAAYVRSTGPQNGDPPEIGTRILRTLAAGLKQCRAGMGDVVVVLPGHTENVTDATMLTNLVAGTRIIGLGSPRQDDAPVFRWTATAAQWAIAAKNVLISGLKLRLEGANGVVKAINITAPGVTLQGNVIEVASGATAKATIAVEVGSAALDCTIQGNYFYGTATHNVTDGIKVVGATVPSRLRIIGNEMQFSATAANGLIHVTVAALQLSFLNNILYNTHTSSSATIAVDNVAADGVFAGNCSGVMNNGTVTAQGIVFAGTATVKCFQNFTTDEPRVSGTLTPVAGT